MVQTYKQNLIWKNDFSLWNYNTKVEPNSSFAQVALGNVYTKRGQYNEALKHYFEALELDPERVKAYSRIGLAFYKLNRYDRAVEFYLKSLEIDQDNVETYNKLIAAYGKQKLYFKALGIYNKAKAKGLTSKNMEANFRLLQKFIINYKMN